MVPRGTLTLTRFIMKILTLTLTLILSGCAAIGIPDSPALIIARAHAMESQAVLELSRAKSAQMARELHDDLPIKIRRSTCGLFECAK